MSGKCRGSDGLRRFGGDGRRSIRRIVGLDAAARCQLSGIQQLSAVVKGHGAKHIARLHRGGHRFRCKIGFNSQLRRVGADRFDSVCAQQALRVRIKPHRKGQLSTFGIGQPGIFDRYLLFVEIKAERFRRHRRIQRLVDVLEQHLRIRKTASDARTAVAALGHAKQHGNERNAVFFCGGHKALAALRRGTGLDADGVFIEKLGILRIGDETVCIDKVQFVLADLVCGDGVFRRFDDLTKGFVLHGVGRKPRHIARSGVMLAFVDAACVDKVRLRHAELRGFCVHQLRKLLHIARNVVGERDRRVIAGRQHEPVQHVAQRKCFPVFQSHECVGRFETGRDRRNGDDLVKGFCMLDRKNAGHDLRRTCGRDLLVGIFCVDQCLGIGSVDDDKCRRENAAVHIAFVRAGKSAAR